MLGAPMKLIIGLVALLFANAAAWASDVKLVSEIFVERVQQDAQGKAKVVLEEPKMVTPGDKLLFVLAYKNEGKADAADFVINNPIPASVSFAGTDSQDAVMSVDGGKTWGKLSSLKVSQPDGTVRSAGPSDVTHVKWQFVRPIPAGSSGKVNFSAVVK